MLRVAINELPSYEIGHEQGLEQGLEQGIQQGAIGNARSTLLKHRFGQPDAASHARIQAAQLPQLAHWTERVLTANSIQDVLH